MSSGSLVNVQAVNASGSGGQHHQQNQGLMVHHHGKSNKKKPKVNKDGVPAPKRATTAYINFTQWYREELKKSGRPIPKIGDFGKECAAKWNQMCEEEKQPFLAVAAKDKERYKKDNPYYKNNEAVIHFYSGNKNTAVHLLSKQINFSPTETIYNYGLMNLFTGNQANAFASFRKCSIHFKKNPRIWLRLAECKLEEMRKNRIDDFDILRRKQDIIWGYVGEGVHRKLIFRGHIDKIVDEEKLLLIRKCLLNSLTLIKSENERDFYPSNYPSEVELKNLTISVMLDLAYVHLCLHDYPHAHTYAMEALELSPDSTQKCLAHLYAGEASVWMDNIKEAIDHFSPSSCPSDERASVYKVVLCYNLSVAYTLRGEFSKAAETLQQLSDIQSKSNQQMLPIQVIVLAIYIKLALGCVDSAKSIIKQHFPQYR
ncbi:CCR4-NOT transcription complex subunit 10-like [Panonychus citri]|uniref:CCR4-NOT transcription complex subunit 10-like n=1 Tax=Panonychus citri TaxID=50023 RepID=UPI0023080189|nr:CCR4-NOT transcription complex subunit 10-like [Panonychus citri]